jgi:L-2-hydroxyglutarate oxidase LhgO
LGTLRILSTIGWIFNGGIVSMNENHLPLLVVGGGIVGLMVAYELSEQLPDLEFALLEQEHYLGDHTTGRNSGVLHAGIYYPFNSLKHRLCIKGNLAWRELARKLDIPVISCGKYIIATGPDQAAALQELLKHAANNGVPGVVNSSTEQLEILREEVVVDSAIFSPSTAIVDVATAVRQLTIALERKGIPVMRDYQVRSLKSGSNRSGFLVETDREPLSCDQVVNCAGIGAIALRESLGLNELSLRMVKGSYLRYGQKLAVKSLIYPLPAEDGGHLGVHSVFDVEGVVRFGPDSLGVGQLDYKMSDEVKQEMWPSIEKIFHKVRFDQLTPDFSGIRPKISYQGRPYLDFWLTGSGNNEAVSTPPGYFEACGIDSPGLTAAPAIARYLVGLIEPK